MLTIGGIEEWAVGTDNGWTRITADTVDTITAGSNDDYAVYIDNKRKVILDGITIKGGKKGGIYIGKSTEDIRIINCDISGWGRTGDLQIVSTNEDGTVKKVSYIDADGNQINYDAGIFLDGTERATIERCFIHDPAGDSTPWASTEKNQWRNAGGLTWESSHPQGVCGIYVNTQNSVVRYNDIVGNEEHRLNDGIESVNNFSSESGFVSDCDIYGNFISFGQDDGTELDGGSANVRYYGNRITNFFSGISTAGNMAGPSFIFNNVVDNLRDGTNYPNFHVKAQTGYDRAEGKTDNVGKGITHIFYNTFYADNGRRDYGIRCYTPYNAVSRNNIIVGGQDRNQITLPADTVKGVDGADFTFTSVSSFDYDLLGNHYLDGNKGKVEILAGNEKEENAIYGMPTFNDAALGLFKLSSGSLGYNAPTTVKGFKGSSMGALDKNSDGLIPIRPVGAVADKYTLSITNGSSATFTVRNTSGKAMPFTVETNDTGGTLTVSPSNGKLTAGGSVAVTVGANFETRNEGNNGAVFVRFEDGLSIPVLVKVN